MIMKAESMNNGQNRRRNDYPELQVGFPERNDVDNPVLEMERVHVDLETLDISRTNIHEFTRELTGSNSMK
jgi:hypothetical protein